MKLKLKYACLVYQGGIANVFSEQSQIDGRNESGRSLLRVRLLQSDFKTCEAYARGLQDAGVTVRSAWCNEAGDIIGSHWRFTGFEDAPFCESFRLVK